jgi:hypothetical protein
VAAYICILEENCPSNLFNYMIKRTNYWLVLTTSIGAYSWTLCKLSISGSTCTKLVVDGTTSKITFYTSIMTSIGNYRVYASSLCPCVDHCLRWTWQIYSHISNAIGYGKQFFFKNISMQFYRLYKHEFKMFCNAK